MSAAPERLDRYMARAVAAYYASAEPFGRGGDFTTAPEISQGFGECLGLWAAAVWDAMGRPSPVLLVELGPGRGTLMADALRAVRDVAPAFAAALRLHLVERSPRLRSAQGEALADADPTWHAAIGTLPGGPRIVIANEFFDALPIRQFVRAQAGWLERHVVGGAFVDLPAAEPPPSASAAAGAVFEWSPARDALASTLAAGVAQHGGAALLLDYGGRGGSGDTLQAIGCHAVAPVLAPMGTVDLSAHVDFAALAAAGEAAGARVHGPIPQGALLQSLGLATRGAMLAGAAARRGQPRAARDMLAGVQRLLAPEAMGRLFKALCLCHPDLPTPAGFPPA